jgi:hypothetical protein
MLAKQLAYVLAGFASNVVERFRVEPVTGDHMDVHRADAPGPLQGDLAPKEVS